MHCFDTIHPPSPGRQPFLLLPFFLTNIVLFLFFAFHVTHSLRRQPTTGYGDGRVERDAGERLSDFCGVFGIGDWASKKRKALRSASFFFFFFFHVGYGLTAVAIFPEPACLLCTAAAAAAAAAVMYRQMVWALDGWDASALGACCRHWQYKTRVLTLWMCVAQLGCVCDVCVCVVLVLGFVLCDVGVVVRRSGVLCFVA